MAATHVSEIEENPNLMTLAKRVELLEAQFDEFRQAVRSPASKDWRRTLGRFAGDEEMRAVFDEAFRLREEDRRQGAS